MAIENTAGGNEERAATYTDEERKRILDYVLGQKNKLIYDFLREHGIRCLGSKADLREATEENLDEGVITQADLVSFLDTVTPWGKQHVFLYDGPEGEIENWRQPEWVTSQVRRHGVDSLLNRRIPLILPETLTLSTIEHSNSSLCVMAVERRDQWLRVPDFDRSAHPGDGREVELRAYEHIVHRGLVIFEWNLRANVAMLRISRLPSGSKYEAVEDAFAKLVEPWLDLPKFAKCDIRKAIAHLHTKEESGEPETRSHGMDYETLQGRRLSARCTVAGDCVFGEPVVDNAMREVRHQGIGRLANLYWLPAAQHPNGGNPIRKLLHTVIVGNKRRINFTKPYSEEETRYVLQRVRELSR